MDQSTPQPPIFKEFAKALGPYLGNFFSSTLLAILFARWMGVHQFGAFALAYHILRLVALLASLGFNLAAVRFLPLYRKERNAGLVRGFLRTGLAFNLVLGLLLGVAIFTSLLPFIEGSHSHHVLKHLWWIAPILGVNVYFSGVMRSLGLASWAAASRGFMRDLGAIGFAYLITNQTKAISPDMAMILFAYAIYVCAFAQVYFLARLFPGWVRRARPRYEIKTWLQSSLPMLASSVAEISVATAGILIIRLTVDERAVGLYHAAWVVSTLALIPTQALTAAAGRHMSRLSDGPVADFARFLTTCLRLQMAATLVVGFGLFVFSRQILLLFGPSYAQAQWLLVALAAAKIFHASSMILARAMALSGHEKAAAKSIFVFAGLNIPFSAILAFYFGSMGVALSYLFFSLASSLYFFNHLRRWHGVRLL